MNKSSILSTNAQSSSTKEAVHRPTIEIDHGTDQKAIGRAIEALGIEIAYTARMNPAFKGKIERLFQILNRHRCVDWEV